MFNAHTFSAFASKFLLLIFSQCSKNFFQLFNKPRKLKCVKMLLKIKTSTLYIYNFIDFKGKGKGELAGVGGT